MKGARAEPSATTRINPSVSSRMMTGASHHFLRTRRKLQNSPKIDNFPFILELLFVVFRRRTRCPCLPITGRIGPKGNFNYPLPEEALEQANRCYHQEKDDR